MEGAGCFSKTGNRKEPKEELGPGRSYRRSQKGVKGGTKPIVNTVLSNAYLKLESAII